MQITGGPVRRQFANPHRMRMPATIRSADDIAWLRDHPRAVRNLPDAGIPICIDALDDTQSGRLRSAIATYVVACGCGTGGALACSSLAIGLALLAARIASDGLHWSDVAWAGAVIGVSVLCAGIGKTLGIAVARVRFVRSCDDALRHIHAS